LQWLKLFSTAPEKKREKGRRGGRHINSPGLGQLYRLIFDGEIAHIAARGLVGRKRALWQMTLSEKCGLAQN